MRAINLKAESAKIVNLNEYHVIAKMNNYNFTLIKANNRVLDWHSHNDTDEVFFIVEGEMMLEFRDKVLDLKAGEFCIVPKGIEHRPVVKKDVTTMLIEPDGTLNADNTGGAYTS